MTETYGMIDISLLHYMLGIKVCQDNTCIIISQNKYAKSILKKNSRCKVESCKLVAKRVL